MMQDWFKQARFGVFVHWGIYAVAGVEASWAFFNHGTAVGNADKAHHLPYDQYMKLAKGFTAARFDARRWARFFKEIGARYAVLTAKHHDGVALWLTETSPLTIEKLTPAGEEHRDIVGEFCEAMRAEGLKVGLYFSHADWSHPDYATVFHEAMSAPAPGREGGSDARLGAARFSYPRDAKSVSPERWEKFLAFHRAQIRELCERYQPDLLWFDGAHERSAKQWRFAELQADIEKWRPGVVINSRIGDGPGTGDYDTPEQVLPISVPRGARPWEYCATLNHQWGFSADKTRLKRAHHLSRILFETASLGGNLLLNIGPREDGTFDRLQEGRLQELGYWIARNKEAIFDTLPGLPHGYVYGPTTLSADRRTLYVGVLDLPAKGDVAVKGVRNRVIDAQCVHSPHKVQHRAEPGAPWHNIPGTIWLEINENDGFDRLGTVVAVKLEGELDLWQ